MCLLRVFDDWIVLTSMCKLFTSFTFLNVILVVVAQTAETNTINKTENRLKSIWRVLEDGMTTYWCKCVLIRLFKGRFYRF